MLSGKLRKLISIMLLSTLVFFPTGFDVSSANSGKKFYTYDQLNGDLQKLVNQYPDLLSMSVEGQSVDKRNIRSITLGKGSKNILITGSLHGSEWITTPVLVETIAAYAKAYRQGTRIQGEPIKYILDNYSITFIPMVNPDGVTLAQEGADAFPQRKDELLDLNPHGDDFSRWKANIRGVDLNRNFNVRWGLPISTPVSFEPSYRYYSGPSPESEPETKVVANWMRKHNPELLLDYHSFGEILYWYYLQTGSVLERDRRIVRAMAKNAGFRMETVRPSTLPSSTLTNYGSVVSKIPSVCVEVGNKSPHLLTMQDLPYTFRKVKYLPLIAIINLPSYVPYFVPVKSVSLPNTLSAVLGNKEGLKPVISPADASNKKLKWVSSHPEIVAVSSTGVITPLELGSATISVTTEDGGHKATSYVTVYESLQHHYGSNQFSTAVELSKSGWAEAETVILARGEDFADGFVAGIPLSHQLDAPLLLTSTDILTPETKDEILRLGAKKVHVLGGIGAIAKSLEEELVKDMGLEVVRVMGYNRFDPDRLNPPDTAIIVYDFNFPDALSVASYAATSGFPILLINQMELDTITLEVLAELGIRNTIVLRGNGVISEEVLDNLPNPIQIKGPDHYATSVEETKFLNENYSNIYFASDVNFADAMMYTTLDANENNRFLLIGKYVPDTLEHYFAYRTSRALILFGGPGSISTGVEISMNDLLQQTGK